MKKFIKIFSLYYRDPEEDILLSRNIYLSSEKKDIYPYRSNGVLLPPYDDNNKQILSRHLFSLKNLDIASTSIIQKQNIKKHTLGIYRHAYPRTLSQNYGYLKETRIITECSLFNNRICFHLNPVIYIEDDIAYYVKNNTVILIYVDPYWILHSKHQYIRGVSFTLTPFPEGRTCVEDGHFTEYNGHVTNRSARGIIPNDFLDLFDEAVLREDVIW